MTGTATFGNMLRELRVAAGLSQEALAERARLSPGAISTLERNARRAPHRQTLALIVEALHLGAIDRERLETAAALARRRAPRANARAGPGAPNNLPHAVTSFHGRQRELRTVSDLLRSRRLVTIFGPGGVGKTRLALELARLQRDGGNFPDGVWFADLAPLTDPALVAPTVARVLGVAQRGDSLTDALARAVAGRRMLVVLDNCEHLLDESARLAEHLNRACANLCVLTTTREALRAEGECVVRLEPMGVEDVRVDSPALALFADRLGDADFERYGVLSPDERAVAAAICRRLDGIPLALELAAARARELRLDAMLRDLDDRFALLNRGRRTASPRQQTLRGAIDWSFALLEPFERRLLARIGIFPGSFTPEAVDAICGESAGGGDVRDALRNLIAKSLVSVVEDAGGRLRYRLLETMRAYALDALPDRDRAECAQRHARYFLTLANAADGQRGRVGVQKIVASVVADLDNFREALAWSLGRRADPLTGAQLAGALGWVYTGLNLAAEGAGWCREALAQNATLDPAVAGRIHAALSFLLHYLGDTGGALAAAAAAVAAYERADAPAELAWSMSQQAWCLVSVGRLADAHRIAERAVALARRNDDPGRLAVALSNLAIAIPPADAAARLAPLLEAVACARALGPDSRGLVGISLARLGDAYCALGDYAAALASIQEALDIARELGNRMVTASHLINVAAYSLAAGRIAGARLAAREALDILRNTDNRATVKYAVEHLGSVAARNGDAARGARLLGAANQFYAAAAMPRQFTEQSLYDATVADLERKLGPASLARHLAEGAAFTLEQAVTEALAV